MKQLTFEGFEYLHNDVEPFVERGLNYSKNDRMDQVVEAVFEIQKSWGAWATTKAIARLIGVSKTRAHQLVTEMVAEGRLEQMDYTTSRRIPTKLYRLPEVK